MFMNIKSSKKVRTTFMYCLTIILRINVYTSSTWYNTMSIFNNITLISLETVM